MTAASIDQLRERLPRAWSRQTASCWTVQNPARGQCSVTAIAVQRLLGGEILKTDTAGGTHFYNRIDGARCDLTASQFDHPIEYQDVPSNAEEALSDTSTTQVETLLKALG